MTRSSVIFAAVAMEWLLDQGKHSAEGFRSLPPGFAPGGLLRFLEPVRDFT